MKKNLYCNKFTFLIGGNKIIMSKILITGGAGFIGSHAAEYFSKNGYDVVVFDNLSRSKLLGKNDRNTMFNWNYLKSLKKIKLVKGDVRSFESLKRAASDAEIIIHAAAQTAVTTSVVNPEPDFSVNAAGTFNVLEVARRLKKRPSIVYCSTNKVYGHNVNKIKVFEEKTRYRFDDKYKFGIPESFSIDLCEHTPYGCSKLAGDIYMQDFSHQYELKIGVFRMSCIYGTRQFGVEDQGWVSWFAIATMMNNPIRIYGDGKQVRDVLFVTDLIRAYEAFLKSDIQCGVFNTGGGYTKTLSLLELLDILEETTGKRSLLEFGDWRPSDQKVYISDISKARRELGWKPEIEPKKGVLKLVEWVKENKKIFS